MEVQLQSDSEEEYNYRVRVKSLNNKKTPKILISINNKSVNVTIDTGSSVNIIDENTYTFLGKSTLKRKHLPKLLPYGGGSHLQVKGCCEVTVEKHGTIIVDKFYLVKGNYGTLLGFQTASDLGVVKITQTVSTSRKLLKEITQEYMRYWKAKTVNREITHKQGRATSGTKGQNNSISLAEKGGKGNRYNAQK